MPSDLMKSQQNLVNKFAKMCSQSLKCNKNNVFTFTCHKNYLEHGRNKISLILLYKKKYNGAITEYRNMKLITNIIGNNKTWMMTMKIYEGMFSL